MRTRLIAGTASAVLIVAGVLVGIWVWMKPPAAELPAAGPPVAETIVVESARSPVYFPRNPPDGKLFEIETVGLVSPLHSRAIASCLRNRGTWTTQVTWWSGRPITGCTPVPTGWRCRAIHSLPALATR